MRNHIKPGDCSIAKREQFHLPSARHVVVILMDVFHTLGLAPGV